MASTVLRSVESNRSLRFSIRETWSCEIPNDFREAYLRELARRAQFLQGHFLSDQLSRARFYLLALRGAQSFYFVFHIHSHSYFSLFFIADRLSVNRVAHARLVAGNKQNGLPLWVEGEGNAPYAVRRVEPQFLHIGETGAVQRIHARPSQVWTELLKDAR
jgi:hypothetical protein